MDVINKKPSDEDDFSFSISNEHNEEELTSVCENGKPKGIISLMNLPHPNFSLLNKNKLSNKKLDFNYIRDNFSTYTSMKKNRKEDSKIDDELYNEVRIFFKNFSIINYYLI